MTSQIRFIPCTPNVNLNNMSTDVTGMTDGDGRCPSFAPEQSPWLGIFSSCSKFGNEAPVWSNHILALDSKQFSQRCKRERTTFDVTQHIHTHHTYTHGRTQTYLLFRSLQCVLYRWAQLSPGRQRPFPGCIDLKSKSSVSRCPVCRLSKTAANPWPPTGHT